MITLTIRHKTTYLYHQPVRLGPHRLLLRPRESRDLRVVSNEVTVSPAASVAWAHDVFGNAVATATFEAMTDRLVIDSVTELRLGADAWPVFDIAASAISFPFRYSDAEQIDLGALALPQYADLAGRLRVWARGFVRSDPTDTLALLKDLGAGVSAWVRYQSREVEGTQSPTETLDRGWGSCRDFAVLFVEAARCLGFGARIISGYLYNPDRDLVGTDGEGSTHAWAEVYVPGAGWITFDPTNRSVGGFNLIPVAVARDIWQATPVAGSFVGMTDAFHGMWVDVSVTLVVHPIFICQQIESRTNVLNVRGSSHGPRSSFDSRSGCPVAHRGAGPVHEPRLRRRDGGDIDRRACCSSEGSRVGRAPPPAHPQYGVRRRQADGQRG